MDDEHDDDPMTPWRHGVERRLRQLIAADSADEMSGLSSMIGLFAGQAVSNVAGLAGERLGIIGMAEAGEHNIKAAADGLASIVRVVLQMAADADEADGAGEHE